MPQGLSLDRSEPSLGQRNERVSLRTKAAVALGPRPRRGVRAGPILALVTQRDGNTARSRPSRRSDLNRAKRRQQLAERRGRRDRFVTSAGRSHVRRRESPAEIFYRHRGLSWLVAALAGAAPTAFVLALAGGSIYLVVLGATAVGIVVFAFFLLTSWLTRTTVLPDLGFPVEGESPDERRERRAGARGERILNRLDAVLDNAVDALFG